MTLRALLALMLTCGMAAGHPDGPSKAIADLVLVNARVWTGDPDKPEVEALAAWQGRVLAVGSTAEIRTLVGPRTKVIDGRGRRVVPGFHDSHAHVLGSGQRLAQVALKDAADAAEFGQRLAAFHQKLPPGRWMLGGEWDHDRTFAGQLPTAADIDRVAGDRPVFLRRYDGHMALANTKAMKLAGITSETPDPTGGVIVRDAQTRQPTGILRDTAMGLVDRLIPPPEDDEIVEAVRAALAEIAKNGVTSVCDMDGSDANSRRNYFRLLQSLARNGQLTARIELRWPLAEWEALARLAVEANFGNDFVRLGGVKGFMDGSLGSSTAKFFAPYVNEPNSSGVFVTPPGRMRDLVLHADKARLSVCVHAIGDEANATMLDIFEDVMKANGPRDRRFRIEHVQHLRPADYQRFGQLGVIASMQPYHAIDDGRWAEGRIGKARCASSYAFRSLLDAGARVAFGSDWSVAPISPLQGIDAAVSRRTLDGKHSDGWFPEQRISVEEALRSYTIHSAYASFQDKERGSLTPGKFADFVVLSRDILASSEKDAIVTTEPLVTVAGGSMVYDARPKSER